MGKKIRPKKRIPATSRAPKANVPAVSQKQQQAMAIALHEPKKLYARNRSPGKMAKGQLEDFARTKRSDLPANKGKLYSKVK